MKIGVVIESYRSDFNEAIKKAKLLNIDGIQAYANTLKIDNISNKSIIKKTKKIVNDEGLSFSAICGDFGCDMFFTQDRTQ